MSVPFRIVPAGDASLIVTFDDRIDPTVNALAIAAADALVTASLPGVLDVVPAFRSVGVYFDPMRIDPAHLLPLMSTVVSAAKPVSERTRAMIAVPVCYGGVYGPDLAHVSAAAAVDEATVIALHADTVYRVYMLGFAPGFAYMGHVDPRIATPRRAEPRTRVAAGSVGIAGGQTGIYPFATPGGWQIIGRTPIQPCDFSKGSPFLFAPGDRVKFQAIDAETFQRMSVEASR